MSSEAQAGSVEHEPAEEVVEQTTVSYRLPRYLLPVAIAFWSVASVAGAISIALPSLPQEVSISLDGRTVDACRVIAPDLVQEDPSISDDWCTSQELLGPTLPDNVEFNSTGTVVWDAVEFDDVLKAATVPTVWFTISLGAIALVFLIAFSQATGTLRAGLAASISAVFFGLLLFPQYFTSLIPGDMRAELIKRLATRHHLLLRVRGHRSSSEGAAPGIHRSRRP